MKTSELLKKHNFRFKKKFGQNFITDNNLLERIVNLGEVGQDDIVLEIGPGAGTLSKKIAEKAKHLIVVEIDTTLIPILEETFKDVDNITIVNEDALKVNYDELVEKFFPDANEYKIIANLPYYITSPLIFNALENTKKLRQLVVMVQKEVADRLQAEPKTKAYGGLTIMASYYSKVTYGFTVSRKLFSPEPDVDSAIVKFEIYEESPYKTENFNLFREIVKAVFMKRRKTFLNSIKNLNLDKEKVIQILEESGFNEKTRGEELPIGFYSNLVNKL